MEYETYRPKSALGRYGIRNVSAKTALLADMEYETYRPKSALGRYVHSTISATNVLCADMFIVLYRPNSERGRYVSFNISAMRMNWPICFIIHIGQRIPSANIIYYVLTTSQISTWFDPTISYYMAAGRIIHIPDHSAAALSTFANPNTVNKPLDDCSLLPIIWRKVCCLLKFIRRPYY